MNKQNKKKPMLLNISIINILFLIAYFFSQFSIYIYNSMMDPCSLSTFQELMREEWVITLKNIFFDTNVRVIYIIIFVMICLEFKWMIKAREDKFDLGLIKIEAAIFFTIIILIKGFQLKQGYDSIIDSFALLISAIFLISDGKGNMNEYAEQKSMEKNLIDNYIKNKLGFLFWAGMVIISVTQIIRVNELGRVISLWLIFNIVGGLYYMVRFNINLIGIKKEVEKIEEDSQKDSSKFDIEIQLCDNKVKSVKSIKYLEDKEKEIYEIQIK